MKGEKECVYMYNTIRDSNRESSRALEVKFNSIQSNRIKAT